MTKRDKAIMKFIRHNCNRTIVIVIKDIDSKIPRTKTCTGSNIEFRETYDGFFLCTYGCIIMSKDIENIFVAFEK